MKKKMNLIEAYEDVGRGIFIGMHRLQGKLWGLAKSDSQKRIMASSAAVTVGGLLYCQGASADGFADMIKKGADQADSIKQNVGKFLSLAGVVSAAVGGWNWYKKGSEGDRSDIKPKQIFVPILAGAVIGGIGYVMLRAGETIGISESEYGNVPG